MLKLKATEIQGMIEDGDPIQALDDALMKVVEALKPGAGDTATLTITIENDLQADDEVETEDEEEGDED